MIQRHILIRVAVAVALSVPAAGLAAERTGQQVVEEVCAVCHAGGRDGAPAIGDHRAWAERAERGLSSLTDSALHGVRRMPPHGGKLSLSDLEIRRAIAYMVNRSGGHWVEPLDPARPPTRRTGAAIVRVQCMKCHAEGLQGAPRVGDKDAWIQRARGGFDNLLRSAIKGHGGMPARGGMADLTDAEMRAAIGYMFQASVRGEPRVAELDGEQVVKQRCASCHEHGNYGAPRIGDAGAWKARATGGLDALVRSATHGHGGMPSRGGMAGLTDDEMRSAVAWLAGHGAP
ncbi:MAG TPA: c-type cytochrome [Myxococcota bacterium]|nr:c-type cytochrome [Myxococcota bacterium]